MVGGGGRSHFIWSPGTSHDQRISQSRSGKSIQTSRPRAGSSAAISFEEKDSMLDIELVLGKPG